ncbi:hypothetical protein [Bradyrhizobium sp. SRS-191]|uniref:hypothetical protein n=1 Tax=Bradyrhizobium sp. SRS-191 TaxID=2962606 RepID=UPI00211EBF33|nr:hypothetical protein [Bradyrhizobium sp. SRS-191]
MTDRPPTEELFVSVCIADPEGEAAACIPVLHVLAARLAERFRYWEILLGIPAESEHHYYELASRIPNLRLLKIRAGTPFYRRRVAIASEAIGDAVVLTTPSELSIVDPVRALEMAAGTGSIVIGRLGGSHALRRALRVLGRGAGFRVDPRDMQTVAFPRTLLNMLLAHPDRTLAMRFPPSDSAIPVRWINATGQSVRRSLSATEFARRLDLMHRLLIASAPRVLSTLAMFSLLVVASAIAYGIYCVTVWLIFSKVQPGWFTISIVTSLTTGFLGSAVFGLSIGIQRLIDLLSADLNEDIVDEIAAVDLFGRAVRELNIEIAGQGAEPVQGGARGGEASAE